MKKIFWLGCLLFFLSCSSVEDYFIEAESFTDKGGWVIDTQSINQISSSYLMAHGLGEPVKNASTTFDVSTPGVYRIWVRTRNWVKPWNEDEAPGKFRIKIDGEEIETIFGNENAEWHWQDGGKIKLKTGSRILELEDLTGFNGRCDAIYITSDLNFIPPTDNSDLIKFRKEKSGLTSTPESVGDYDLVVIGGGIAGCCTAISAARLGCKVALIQNRPVLGGNNSSEVRVGLSGLINQAPYPNLGNLLDELGVVGYWNNWEAAQAPETERSKQIQEILKEHPEKKIHNAGPESNYEDEKKKKLIDQEKNITLFLNTHVIEVEKDGNTITSVTGKNIETGKEYIFNGKMFADCTGDGDVGFLAGADYRMGRESKEETNEPRAPEKTDQLVMGTSVQWYAEEYTENSLFPECPWAIQFNEETCSKSLRGDWDWETGLTRNQITEIEYIRDYALRAVFGNWDYLKNKSQDKLLYANKKLEWVAYIGGKRESRRLLGDVVLTENDILNKIPYPDATFTTTWGVDLHYPKPLPGMEEEPFLSYADIQDIDPYAVPYRCLYSRNIDNLFMAGRNISVTHVALGTVRVMRTGGMMGEVVGMAASLCKEHEVLPRDIYTSYFPELQKLMDTGVAKSGFEYMKTIKILGN